MYDYEFIQGRKRLARSRRVVVQVTGVEIAEYSPYRVCIIISSHSAGGSRIVVNNSLQNAGAEFGITLYPAGPPLILRIEDFGSLVLGPIFANSPEGVAGIAITEVFLNDPAGLGEGY